MRARNVPGVTQIQRLFRVSDPHGLHARVAVVIARAADQFEADIVVHCGHVAASGRSLLGLLSLCAGPGELLTIVAEGIDAEQSMRALEALLRRHASMIGLQ